MSNRINDQRENNKILKRLKANGPKSLLPNEIIQLLLGISQEKLNDISLQDILLEKLDSLSDEDRTKLLLLNHISKILAVEKARNNFITPSPKAVAMLLMPEMRCLQVEKVMVLCLDNKYGVLDIIEMSSGTMDSALVMPREIYQIALKSGAAKIMIAHNHPSGRPQPSSYDISFTKRLIAAGELIGIPCIDHIIIGDNEYYSMADKGDM